MEDLELLDAPLIDTTDMTALLLRFLFNTVFAMIIIAGLYYPKSKRREYFFTFALISISIFFLIYLLGSVKIKVGFALGLFAIFGIIRYRTESMSVREMTYLFVIIAISVINALAVSLSFGELTLTNLIFVGFIYLCEKLPFTKAQEEKLVLYDRIDLIHPDKEEELLEDLKNRLGLEILAIQIGAVDFLHDTAMIKVFYRSNKKFGDSTVNRIMKLPKE
ncbi:MAG: DUF4956 domain-containing protein [Paramuribaculum sp.]|nr:DUF4956 domain-containing protein [Bacteroidales bacterium]MDE6248722.1 DUF4956 domain-containing protein [Paramuribaculum sp.]MDE7448746.1 DUF4956 domain-containing protein [Paramuribaculum sp.]